MNASRRMYTVAIGAASVVLAGTMIGAVAYAADGGPTGSNDSSWNEWMNGGMMNGGWNNGGMMNGGWNNGGMFGQGWNQGASEDAPAVTLDQATKIAGDWIAANYPGATVGAGTPMPIGYWFVASKDGSTIAHVMVNDDTGQVLATNGRSFGGMMGGGWGNATNGTTGGGMMGQGRWAASPAMSGRSA
ncbi:MAG: hypothetical protein Q7V58_02250 [Actinomycetota bacterium]|nr:hypothetical protein [Actinomycetota bacterium]